MTRLLKSTEENQWSRIQDYETDIDRTFATGVETTISSDSTRFLALAPDISIIALRANIYISPHQTRMSVSSPQGVDRFHLFLENVFVFFSYAKIAGKSQFDNPCFVRIRRA